MYRAVLEDHQRQKTAFDGETFRNTAVSELLLATKWGCKVQKHGKEVITADNG